MLEPIILFLISFLLAMLMIYLWASRGNLIKIRTLTPQDYLWKLKQITGKSEYEIFMIAAAEKGWPEYQVEKHFKRYLADQTLPVYVKEFLEDGKEYINMYRPKRGNFFDKKTMIFFSLFALLVIGGSFVFCLYFYPRTYPFSGLPDIAIANAIEVNPRLARPFINRAISHGEKGQIEKACSDLKLVCGLGYCEYYVMKKKDGVCQ